MDVSSVVAFGSLPNARWVSREQTERCV